MFGQTGDWVENFSENRQMKEDLGLGSFELNFFSNATSLVILKSLHKIQIHLLQEKERKISVMISSEEV